jgi:copper ion binding protein
LVAGVISYLVNPSWIEGFAANPFIAYPLMLAVAIPLYVCATGSIPVAVALMAKGVSAGAALVFLVAGPATNAITIGIVGKLLGKKSLAIYLATIIVGSVLLGLGMDWMSASPGVPVSFHHLHADSAIRWWEWASAALLGLVLLYALAIEPLLRRVSAGRARPDTVFSVPGMTCEHCVRTLETCVSGVEGVEKVWVSLDKKTVSVRGGTKENVQKAIEEAGYTVSEQ